MSKELHSFDQCLQSIPTFLFKFLFSEFVCPANTRWLTANIFRRPHIYVFFLWNVIGCVHIQHFPVCFSANEVCFARHPCWSAEGVVFTLEIVCQGRLNLLAHNVISPLGDRAPFVQQQEISLRAPKTFLVPRPHPFTNCVL